MTRCARPLVPSAIAFMARGAAVLLMAGVGTAAAAGLGGPVAVAVTAAAPSTCSWTARALPALPGGVDATGDAINDSGVVVGNAKDAVGGRRPVVWGGSRVVALSRLRGSATAVDAAGRVAGYVILSGATHAFRWSTGRLSMLPEGSAASSMAEALEGDTVVGSVFTLENRLMPAVWRAGKLQVGTLPAGYHEGTAVDIVGGRIVGNLFDARGGHAAELVNGRWRPIGPHLFTAEAANSTGRVFGAADAHGAIRPALLRSTGLRTFGLPAGLVRAGFNDANNRNDAVGWSITAKDVPYAVVSLGGGALRALPSLSGSTGPGYAWGMNAHRMATGWSKDAAGNHRGVIWSCST